MPGRMHDARVFRISPLYRQLIEDPRLLPPQQHILGDAAYPLLTNLLKPYRDNGHLTEQQTRFNQSLAAQRSAIERAFGLLKDGFNNLEEYDVNEVIEGIYEDNEPENNNNGVLKGNYISTYNKVLI
ncbi:dde superfamily endonuclease [Holotrichia oblita]|uniref:Dde superfamily endonuclease n=1 Tax=Holotrichia oblita TaxID=644536 RepID=A0ACB9SJZ3_HOLOL|nr:dde superfamily endonuclease [Holotrichia oblita]